MGVFHANGHFAAVEAAIDGIRAGNFGAEIGGQGEDRATGDVAGREASTLAAASALALSSAACFSAATRAVSASALAFSTARRFFSASAWLIAK